MRDRPFTVRLIGSSSGFRRFWLMRPTVLAISSSCMVMRISDHCICIRLLGSSPGVDSSICNSCLAWLKRS